jgi:hypothetical protein
VATSAASVRDAAVVVDSRGVGREAVAIAVEVALGVFAGVLLLRPIAARWRRHVAVRWPAYDAAWHRAPERTRKHIRRELLRGHSVADAPELLGLASIELTHRIYRAAAIRPRRGLPRTVLAQFAVLPLVLVGLYVIGDRAARITGVAGIALLATILGYYLALRLRNTRVVRRVAQARAATESDLERAGEDLPAARTRVRALLDGLPGREVKAQLARQGSVGWLPIIAFVTAAFVVGAWGDSG